MSRPMRVARRWLRVGEVRVRRWGPAVATILALAVLLPPAVLLATGSPASASRSSALVLLWGGYALALLLGSGGWAAERRSGSIALWVQKPVRPALLQLDRLVPRLIVTALAILVLTGVGMVAVAALEGGAGVADVRTGGCTMLVTGVVLVCMLHGVSGLGLPREELVVLAGFAGLSLLEWKAIDSPGSFGALLPVARALGVPVDGIGYTGRLLGGAAVADPFGHALQVALYALGWVAVGTAGVALTPRPLASCRD